MITQYNILHQRLLAEWANVKAAAAKAQAAYASTGPFNVDATALSLHGFYSGLERIFEWIARQIDMSLPDGPAWHREILSQMTLDVPGIRPPVLKETTAKHLAPFLGFRHIVRNLYAWELEQNKVEQLIEQLPETVQAVESDFETFGRFLEVAGRADEIT